MKLLPLTKGKFAIVDDEDFEFVSQWKWQLGYRDCAQRSVFKENGQRHTIYLHREVTKAPDGVEVDHIDSNRLNCQKSNLRFCTHNLNVRNALKRSTVTSSKYKGVCWHKRQKKFNASIRVDGKRYNLGSFTSDKDAAIRYNEAARIYHGEFAKLNEV